MFIRDMKADYNRPPYNGVLTAEYLRWNLRYDPETGQFTRLRHRYGRTTDGAKLGSPMAPGGYLRIGICDKLYLAHRLAYLYMTGEWPPEEVDHVNMVRGDNRWANLRAASRRMNLANRKPKREGLKGVWQRPSGRWAAAAKNGTKGGLLGTFNTEEEAHAAYQAAAAKLFGSYARFE